MPKNLQSRILEGSRAIALTVKDIGPDVVSAYPITPQTHIVEDLAKFKADGEAAYEYVRAESEFAAASIVLGSSAAGARVYTATSSQGLLLMTEVVYNIAGMHLPIVMTCANRAVSAPINIWNDQQDAMAVRDAGWIMFFAENHQEAAVQHVLAYKIAEKLNLPVMVNVDGFVLTHTYEPVKLPEKKIIKKFLPDRRPKKGEYLDIDAPVTLGAFATPAHYLEIRQKLQTDLMASLSEIEKEYQNWQKISGDKLPGNSALEFYGPANAETVFVAMGSVIGTIKDFADEYNKKNKKKMAVLKVKTFRPFPTEKIISSLKRAKEIAVIDKSIALGLGGTIYSDLRSVAYGRLNAKIKGFVAGLGGRDINQEKLGRIADELRKNKEDVIFIS